MEEVKRSIDVSVTAGFIHGDVSGELNVSLGLSDTLAEDVREAYQHDYSISSETTCISENNDGAGLYQWVVSSGDRKHNVFTWHTVCRTGALWNTKPACPWPACLNAECSECMEGY